MGSGKAENDGLGLVLAPPILDNPPFQRSHHTILLTLL